MENRSIPSVMNGIFQNGLFTMKDPEYFVWYHDRVVTHGLLANCLLLESKTYRKSTRVVPSVLYVPTHCTFVIDVISRTAFLLKKAL